jgi:hypothetical protein
MILDNFHKNAIANYNEKAENLISLIKLYTEIRDNRPKYYSSTMAIPKKEINNGQFTYLSSFTVDLLTGNENAKYFKIEGKRFGLEGTDYENFNLIVRKISLRKEIRDYLSVSFVRSSLFDWIQKRYRNQLPTAISFMSYLDQEAKRTVKWRLIGIPILYLAIDQNFTLGKVEFDYLRKELFDDLGNHFRETMNDQEYADENIKRLREEYQGKVIAKIKIYAEKEKALEIAKEEIEKTIAFLRFYSPSSFEPGVPSYFDLMDIDRNQLIHFVHYKENQFPDIQYVRNKNIQCRDPRWSIGDIEIKYLNSLSIIDSHELLCEPHPSEIDDLIINCVNLYSRSLTSVQYQEKIVFCLVALETLLLANEQEPILESVSKRLVEICAESKKERKKVESVFYRAYRVRTSFIHHGKFLPEDIDLLRMIRLYTRMSICFLLSRRKEFENKDKFINAIDSSARKENNKS